MRNKLKRWSLLSALLLCMCGVGMAQGQAGRQTSAPDLSKQPTLYVVPYAHLDTQWNWDYPKSIEEYLPATMRDNFALFEKYPHYTFSFSGANRYRMMKEYYPADYARVKQYVAAGRWFPAGSAMEESDVNSPSAESVIRQILYGTHYFRREFGKTSAEYMLPDCFGFPASLPSILAHMGIKGFSTQKLTWHSASRSGGPGSVQDTPVGIPFNVGFWRGPDGKGVIAALNGTTYSGDVTEDLTTSPAWNKRLQADGKSMGLFVDFRYYGTGDMGGAPREPSVALMEGILTKGKAAIPDDEGKLPPSAPIVAVGNGPLHVLQTTAEQMFLDIPANKIGDMPKYQGDLELIEHSAGSLTSQAYMKKWNRANEVLADEAERASVAATWLGARSYPQERLNNAWTLVMGGQFHDIIPGTSIPKAYEYSWNDEALALNQFAGVLTSATQGVASGLDTQVKGTAVVVYNALNIHREDVVEATIAFPNGKPNAVRVTGPDGKDVPAQLEGNKVVFVANAPSVGYAVYDVQAADAPAASTLKATESSLENARYRLTLNQDGDVASIFDKKLKKEILASPLRLAFKNDRPNEWPAWNMDWADQRKAPRAYVGGPAQVRVVEQGPARVALEVTREDEGSTFVETIRLAAGDAGNRVEFSNAIDWHTEGQNLKAMFPLTAANSAATYNLDLGTIQRGNDDEKKFEVVAHQWFDLTDKNNTFGVTVLSGAKNGSDKPNDNTLGLTLVRTPGIGDKGHAYEVQASQDLGHHDFTYGLTSHAGDWRQEQSYWQGFRLDAPLVAFESTKHAGSLGKSFSLLRVSSPRVRVLALKKAEESDEVIVRLVELDGKPQQNVRVAFAGPIASAREVNGQELELGAANVEKGELVTSFTPYEPRTFAVKLAAPTQRLGAPTSTPVALTYDRAVATPDGRSVFGGFDSRGRSLPAEMLPTDLKFGAIDFKLAPATNGNLNAVTAMGQTIALPEGRYNKVYVLAASAGRDQKATFKAGDNAVRLILPSWTGYVGQWDNRLWNNGEAIALTPGFIKKMPVAWFASHRHGSDGSNEAYKYSYLYAATLDLAPNSRTLTLPYNDNIRILAVTVADENEQVQAAQPLYDTLQNTAGAAVAAMH